MPTEDKKLDRFAKILKESLDLATDGLTKDDFLEAFQVVYNVVKDIKTTNDKEFDGIHEAFKELSRRIKEEKDTDVKDLQGQVKDMLVSFNGEKTAKWAEVEAKLVTIKNGDDGLPGQDADAVAIKNAVLSEIQIPTIEELRNDLPKLSSQIRDALELLQDEERLDASAIRNLPEATRQWTQGVLTATALYSLADVSVEGILVGQSIKWDGIRWIPYTPAGGSSGTSVYGENLTPQGPGTSYTLAHTPQAGTVRLYRGGAYQQVGVDYTISGATITLTQTTQAGETLLADYLY